MKGVEGQRWRRERVKEVYGQRWRRERVSLEQLFLTTSLHTMLAVCTHISSGKVGCGSGVELVMHNGNTAVYSDSNLWQNKFNSSQLRILISSGSLLEFGVYFNISSLEPSDPRLPRLNSLEYDGNNTGCGGMGGD